MPARFATPTANGCARLLNAPRRGRSDRAGRPLIAIDPLLESRHEACGTALNTPERASRLASHRQCAPRLRERKNIASVTRKGFEMSARIVDEEWRGQH